MTAEEVMEAMFLSVPGRMMDGEQLVRRGLEASFFLAPSDGLRGAEGETGVGRRAFEARATTRTTDLRYAPFIGVA